MTEKFNVLQIILSGALTAWSCRCSMLSLVQNGRRVSNWDKAKNMLIHINSCYHQSCHNEDCISLIKVPSIDKTYLLES